MAKPKRTPFAVNKEGTEMFVRLDHSGINTLVAICDGLPMTFFGRDDVPYLTVDQAIAWHEKELEDSAGHSGNRTIADCLKECLRKFHAGRVEYT